MPETIELRFKFDIGDVVTHLLHPSGAAPMLILDRSYTDGAAGIAKQYHCRVMTDHVLTATWFHEHELRSRTRIGENS